MDATPKAKTLFEHIKAVLENQRPDYWQTLTDADKKTWSNYMVTKFLSMDTGFTGAMNELQKYTTGLQMDPEVVYRLYSDLLPKGKRYLKYTTGAKTSKYPEWFVRKLVAHFHLSERDVMEYAEMLYSTDEGRAELRDVLEMYATDPKDIKKLKL